MCGGRHHDTLEHPPSPVRPADMWQGWNLGARPVEGNVVSVPPWWEVHDLPMPTPDTPLREIAELRDGAWALR